MATLVLQIPDESLVQKVKQACKMIVGVASVKVQKTTPIPPQKIIRRDIERWGRRILFIRLVSERRNKRINNI